MNCTCWDFADGLGPFSSLVRLSPDEKLYRAKLLLTALTVALKLAY